MTLSRIAMLQAVLFTTGAVTLALELVASRILTPVFGSSLYVWTGILTVTLCCLALGYDLGGRWSRKGPDERIGERYAVLPLGAAVYLLAAAALHPALLDGLHAMDIVLGALAGCMILLGPVLIVLSAMNPLLSALAGAGRDGGGRAFAISTAGSVCGVLFTSFVLVPRLSAPDILLVLSAMLGLCALAATLVTVRATRRTQILVGAGLLTAALLALFLVPRTDTARIGTLEAERLATYRSSFGDIHVVEAGMLDTRLLRLYIQNGGLQGGVDSRNRSVTAYTGIVTHALSAARPAARRILIVGLGAGILPRDFSRTGRQVTVFEIDRTSVTAAERHFGLPVDDVAIRIGDARILLDDCRQAEHAFDAIILDAFSGIEMPGHLLTVEFFAKVRQCLAPGGVVLGNLILPGDETPLTRAVLGTVIAGLGQDLVVYRNDPRENRRKDGGKDRAADPNLFATLVFLSGPDPGGAAKLSIPDFPVALGVRRPVVIEGRPVRRHALAGADILTDRRNRYDWLAAAGQAAARRQITVVLPSTW
ncbi:MAG TPA: fused MFS/spermidine synthase [Arenibaculum sp.]|nr:fused MFS/spermidine synthase [Arenibaculum sp.]